MPHLRDPRSVHQGRRPGGDRLTETPENELLRRTGAGDRAAFSALVQATQDGVWRLVRSLTADEGTAEDALQETFVDVWRSGSSYRGEGSARAWIYGVARRKAARTWRRHAGEPTTPVPLHELGAQAGWGRDPEELAAAIEDADRLHQALDRLSVADREIIVLHDLEGLSGPEIARILEITANAARVRLHRARLRLMGLLRLEDCNG